MTRIVKDYEERREEILQTAQGLFYTQGYENTSVQNIIDAVGIAKGTFYHYFDSKQDLLDELIADITQNVKQALETMVTDPQLNAFQKLQRFFQDSQAVKLENIQVLQTLTQVIYKDENAILREKMKAEAIPLFIPMLADTIRQGIAEGSFNCETPDDLAAILMTIIQGYSEMFLNLLSENELNNDFILLALQKTAVYERAIERLLGAAPGSLKIISPEQVENWFALDMRQLKNRSARETMHINLEQEGTI